MASGTCDRGGGAVNSDPEHLLSEDRQEYERILDEALRSAPDRPELAAVGQRLNTEQLRTMALNATALITAAAATEYQHYVKVREELRHPAQSSRDTGSAEPRSSTTGLATTMGEVAETTGAGALGAGPSYDGRASDGIAVHRWARMSYGRRLLAAVLGLHVRPDVPAAARAARPSPFSVFAAPATALSGTIAAIFLLVGYILTMLDPEPAAAQTMLTTGWTFGAVTAAAILVTAVGLLITALRSKPSLEAGPYRDLTAEVTRAREAWHNALLECGILPFLREALADPGTDVLRRPAPPAPTIRTPHLGYDRPGFSSPDDATPAPRPSFTSPDYTSPDFGGPERQPE
ncbi:hypothetical protein ACIRP7_36560 [Streptomyces sp. NPDC102270]|uniref:hypothetical protein n=1 Tax=Streptomyces sp. NPDC102270 TaxID=3366150 RepID=UPI0038277F3E